MTQILASKKQSTEKISSCKQGRFSTNIASNIANFCLTVLVNLWFTPYLIKHLGIAAYGLIPLATGITSYLSLFTLALNSAVGRYITIASEQGNARQANRIFNTSFFGSLFVVLVLAVPVIWLTGHVSRFFYVPAGYELDARWLFMSTVAVFMLTQISTPFDVASFCRNRFDLRNVIAILGLSTRVGMVVLLFNLVRPSITYVGLALVAAGVVMLIGSVTVWRYLMPQLHVRPADFDRGTVAGLASTGGWMVINQVGTLLYLSIDLIVINRLVGPEAGGQYAAVMQWSVLLRSLAGVIAGTFGPTIIYYYARGDIDGLVSYSQKSMKFLGLLIALPIGLICGFSRPLLEVWLGQGFVPLAPLMSIMTIHLAVNLGVLPLFNIQAATNKVRIPGIVTCLMGFGNLGMALLLTGPVGLGVYGTALAGAIMLTAKNAVFTPLYGARILKQSYGTFYLGIVRMFAMVSLTAGLCWLISSIIDLGDLPRLGAAGMLVGATYLAVAYTVLISSSERDLLKSKLRSMLRL